MFFTTLYRVSKFAWQSFFRNFWLSLVTVTIILLSLISATTLVGLNAVSDAMIDSLGERVDIAVYFKPGTTDETLLLSREQIQKLDGVKTVEVVSADDALEFFKNEHKNDATVQSALEALEENPLGPILQVYANDIYAYGGVLEDLATVDFQNAVDDIDFQDRRVLIDKLNQITTKVRWFVTVLSSFFIIISVLVVFNTIRLGIYAHKEEIMIMKLVGATNWFTGMPFIIEGFIYAVLSVVIFWALFLGLLTWIDPYVSGFLQEINFSLKGYFTQNLFTLVWQQLVALVIINSISAFIAIRRYLRV